ncbi:hypothetical protein RvY_09379 [Ramazzottius varieornatus]|uniref:Uncharacterized protein n=1 Tax=Ramazzottius varieornatus TaxID=947166 RepID=A0A1D1V938_RAMVA|nr:hypothetical protein RvY_09379 [Ramazzottius varieornatus]
MQDRRAFVNLGLILPQKYDLDVSSDVDSVLSNFAGALQKYAGKDRKRKIDSFTTWLDAFIISSNLWLEYDQRSRMIMKHAGSTDLEWRREDPDLKAAVVRGNTRVVLPTSHVSRETKCYNCSQYGHIAVG